MKFQEYKEYKEFKEFKEFKEYKEFKNVVGPADRAMGTLVPVPSC